MPLKGDIVMALQQQRSFPQKVYVRRFPAVPLDDADRNGSTALHAAAENGNARVIRGLVADGAKIDAKDAQGRTPLLIAVRQRHLKVAADLIALGADINAETRNGWTALSLAVKSGNPQMIELIAKTAGLTGLNKK